MNREKKAVLREETVQIVSFSIGAEGYGLPINSVAEVVRPLAITPLPRMPNFAEGVINLRGVIIPVVDMRQRFELAQAEIKNDFRTRMMITRGAVPGHAGADQQLLALVVDGVQEVLSVPQKNIDSAPEAARGPNADFISGMAKMEDRLIILLDITTLLSHEERQALAEAQDG